MSFQGLIAIVNAGLIVNGIEADKVTEYDIHRMLPHPINIVRVRLTGKQLKQVIQKPKARIYARTCTRSWF